MTEITNFVSTLIELPGYIELITLYYLQQFAH